MHIPQFWAEGRVRDRGPDGQRTVRRFGWSDISQADAQAVADRRAAEALQRLLAGQPTARREPKVPYNGAGGLPIREQILARHGDTILTRNAYGAVCLNTPNVLFVDMDADGGYDSAIACGFGCLATIVAIVLAVWAKWWPGVALAVLGLMAFAWVVDRVQRWRAARRQGTWAVTAVQRVVAFVDARPGWHVRVYRTPAGLRVLALHRTFDPNEPDVTECFQQLKTDRQYVTMCQRQQCFRARVSPKPWRIGIDHHIRPRPGVWPVKPEWLPVRDEWVAEYDAAAAGFAACRFVGAFGDGPTHPAADAVRRLHDELCRAEADLPIA